MAHCKNRSCDQGGEERPPDEREHSIVKQGIERDLLQNAECAVGFQSSPRDQVWRETYRGTQRQPDDNEHEKHQAKENCGLLRCRPEIVSTPAERLGRVGMEQETNREPRDEYQPGPMSGELKTPNEPENECGHENDIGKREQTAEQGDSWLAGRIKLSQVEELGKIHGLNCSETGTEAIGLNISRQQCLSLGRCILEEGLSSLGSVADHGSDEVDSIDCRRDTVGGDHSIVGL